MNEPAVIPNYIYTIRNVPVMLDSDLAMMYGIATERINQAVKRNPERFPSDFMFQLTRDEYDSLRSQFVISKGKGGRRYMPYVFTEPGVAMLSSVLNSPAAIKANIAIIRTFIKMRNHLNLIQNKSKEISELREMLMLHIDHTKTKLSKHDEQIRDIATALNAFLAEPPKPRRPIGFRP
ncbi:MAG: ORF6N domain-containing protein [Proteobacteria bacterium]|nr:ORF6N domain-containing protein [Pseudomonadota bacterium]